MASPHDTGTITDPAVAAPGLRVERQLQQRHTHPPKGLPTGNMTSNRSAISQGMLDAYDALIMLQIADSALAAATVEVNSLKDLVIHTRKHTRRPEKNIFLMEQLETHLDRYANTIVEAQYQGYRMLSLDAGEFLFELGNTHEHVVVLKHEFTAFATEYYITDEGSYGYCLAHIPFIPGLLLFDPLGVVKIDQLMTKIIASRHDIQTSLEAFTNAIEDFEKNLVFK